MATVTVCVLCDAPRGKRKGYQVYGPRSNRAWQHWVCTACARTILIQFRRAKEEHEKKASEPTARVRPPANALEAAIDMACGVDLATGPDISVYSARCGRCSAVFNTPVAAGSHRCGR